MTEPSVVSTESQDSGPSLNRALGLATSVLLVAGLMIGSGVFKKIAPMSRSLGSETWIIAAWIIAGIITLFGAFTYSGFATITTRTGGIYEYLRFAFGDFTSFVFGWSFFTITGSGAVAALAFIFSQSINTVVHLPEPFGVKLLAITTIGVLTWLNGRGIKQGGVLNNIVTMAKIGGILLLIIAGLWYTPAAGSIVVPETVAATPSGLALISALFGAMLSALWAYDGWSNITFITGEIKDPKRNLPLAIVGGVSIAMFLYVMLNYSFMRVLSISQLAAIPENQIAAAVAAGEMMGRTGTVIIAILIMTCTFGAVNACIIVYPRLYYRMAGENRFFKKAAIVHPRFRTPHIALIYSFIWSSVLILTGTFDLLTNLVVLASYFFFGLSAWGLIKLKRKKIITAKTIAYPVAPVVVILFSIVLIINNIIREPVQSLICLLLVASSLPFYWYFKKVQR